MSLMHSWTGRRAAYPHQEIACLSRTVKDKMLTPVTEDKATHAFVSLSLKLPFLSSHFKLALPAQ